MSRAEGALSSQTGFVGQDVLLVVEGRAVFSSAGSLATAQQLIRQWLRHWDPTEVMLAGLAVHPPIHLPCRDIMALACSLLSLTIARR